MHTYVKFSINILLNLKPKYKYNQLYDITNRLFKRFTSYYWKQK